MRWLAVPMTLLIFLGSISAAWAQVQSHPLSQISPIDSNLNMYTYNNSVGYLNYSYGILNNGTQGILTADIASSAVTGSRIASNAITSSKISNPLGGLINATAYYDSDNSNYYLDPASTGNSLYTAGTIICCVTGGMLGVGDSSGRAKLVVDGNVSFGSVGPGSGQGVQLNYTDGGAGITEFAGWRWGEEWRWEHGTSTGLIKQMVLDNSNNLALYTATGAPASSVIGVLLNPQGNSYFNNTGNVGIGTANPSSILTVNGAGTSGANGAGTVLLSTTNTLGPSLAIAGGTVFKLKSTNGGDSTEGSNKLVISNVGSNASLATIDSSGNIGIGTTSPAYALDVAGQIHTGGPSPKIVLDTGGDVVWPNGASSHGIDFGFGSTIMRQAADGRVKYTAQNGVHEFVGSVGIGTSSPQNTLNVIGTINATGKAYSEGAEVPIKLGNKTLTSNSNVITLSGLSAKKYLEIRVRLLTTTNSSGYLRLNGDSGSNYRYALDQDGVLFSGAGATSSIGIWPSLNSGNATIYIQATNSNDNGDFKTMTFQPVASGGSIGAGESVYLGSGSWGNSTSGQINRVDVINTGTGTFLPGSEITVTGHD